MKKNFSTPGTGLFDFDRQYMEYERMRGTRSHADLNHESSSPLTFSRTSSLADLAYVALPGLTSRVSLNNSVVSLANLEDAFSTMPVRESKVFAEIIVPLSLLTTRYFLLIARRLSAKRSLPTDLLSPEITPPSESSPSLLEPLLPSTPAPPHTHDQRHRLHHRKPSYPPPPLSLCYAHTQSALMPQQGGLSRPLVQSVAVALLSTLLYGYNNGNMNTPALSIRAYIGIPSVVLTPEGASFDMPSNDTLWGEPQDRKGGVGVVPMLLESPRWYAMYGNERMAEEQLVLLRDRDPTDEARYAVGIEAERRREGGTEGRVRSGKSE
ncbi:MAG: hypothetical protein SGPRY_004321 [Prymnesium sp.]